MLYSVTTNIQGFRYLHVVANNDKWISDFPEGRHCWIHTEEMEKVCIITRQLKEHFLNWAYYPQLEISYPQLEISYPQLEISYPQLGFNIPNRGIWISELGKVEWENKPPIPNRRKYPQIGYLKYPIGDIIPNWVCSSVSPLMYFKS